MEQSNLAGFLEPHDLQQLMDISSKIKHFRQKDINYWNGLDKKLGYNGIKWPVKLYSSKETPEETDHPFDNYHIEELFKCVNLLELRFLSALYVLTIGEPNSIGIIPPVPPTGGNG